MEEEVIMKAFLVKLGPFLAGLWFLYLFRRQAVTVRKLGLVDWME